MTEQRRPAALPTFENKDLIAVIIPYLICSIIDLSIVKQVTCKGTVDDGGSPALDVPGEIKADAVLSLGKIHQQTVVEASGVSSFDPIVEESGQRTIDVHGEQRLDECTILPKFSGDDHASESPNGLILVPKDAVS